MELAAYFEGRIVYEFVVLFLIRSEYCRVILVKQQSQSPR